MLTTQTNKETRCKCSQHNQIHFICSAFIFWLCCEHLQHVRCQFDESCFLNLQGFFLFATRFVFWLCCEHLQHVRCQNDESCFLNLQGFFLFATRFFFWLCCEHLQHVRCQNDESCFLNLQGFFLFATRFFFGCVVSICSMCVVNLTKVVFLICRCFFLFAARWALSATVETLIEGLNEIFIHVYFAWKIVVKRSSSCSSLPFELRHLYIELSCHIKEHHNGIIWISWKKVIICKIRLYFLSKVTIYKTGSFPLFCSG